MTRNKSDKESCEVNFTRTTLLLILVLGNSLPILFSSCSTVNSASANSGGNLHADQEHYNTTAIGYNNDSPDDPDTFGTPLGVAP
jgi:hypothetical protein